MLHTTIRCETSAARSFPSRTGAEPAAAGSVDAGPSDATDGAQFLFCCKANRDPCCPIAYCGGGSDARHLRELRAQQRAVRSNGRCYEPARRVARLHVHWDHRRLQQGGNLRRSPKRCSQLGCVGRVPGHPGLARWRAFSDRRWRAPRSWARAAGGHHRQPRRRPPRPRRLRPLRRRPVPRRRRSRRKQRGPRFRPQRPRRLRNPRRRANRLRRPASMGRS